MSRRGSALPMVLFLLVLLLGLSALAASQARLRWLAGSRALAGARLDVTAADELGRTEAAWDPQLASRLGVGSSALFPAGGIGAPGFQVEDTLRRLGRWLYERRLTLERRTPDSLVLARVALRGLFRVVAPALPDSGAVHVGTELVLESGALVDGGDTTPPGWGGVCSGGGGSVAGVRLGPGGALGGTCGGTSCLRGTPAVAIDSALPAAILGGPGGWSALASSADLQASGAVTGPAPVLAPNGSCDRMQPLNWGDPGNPAAACGDYFPLILVQPGAVVTGGIGQGLLLALGPLSLAGDLEFEGVILGLGGVELRDAARVRGVVIARDTVRISGTASVQWSSCAANRARIGAGQPARVAGWGASHAQ